MMRPKKQLHTVIEVIDAMKEVLPGHRLMDVAVFLRVSSQMVCWMRKHEQIPREHHRPIEILLTSQGYQINEEVVFGYSLDTLLRPFEDTDVNRPAA